MKKVLFLQLIALTALLSACHKDNDTDIDDPGPGPQPALDKQLVALSYSTEIFAPVYFGYDNEGRLNKCDGDEDSSFVAIKKDSVFIKEFRKADNRYVYDFKGKLDAKGRILSGQATASYSINFPYVGKYSFTYDANGYMTEQRVDRSDNHNYRFEYKYVNGDLKTLNAYHNEVFDYGREYEYFTDMPDKTGVEFEKFYNCHNGLSGKTNQHLVKSAKGIRADGNVSWTYSQTYTLDAKGYPVSSDIESSSWGAYRMFYHYQ